MFIQSFSDESSDILAIPDILRSSELRNKIVIKSIPGPVVRLDVTPSDLKYLPGLYVTNLSLAINSRNHQRVELSACDNRVLASCNLDATKLHANNYLVLLRSRFERTKYLQAPVSIRWY